MGVFDNAKIVKINNTEVDSIKTNDGKVIYQRPVIAIVTNNTIQLGYPKTQWLFTNGNVIIDWGDNTQSTVNNPTTELTHSYTDGKQSHNIVFLGNVTSLGERCFNGSGNLTSITIPLSVTSLGEACFYYCTNLTSISISNNITSLGEYCFYNCDGLTSITIPSSVTNIGKGCFEGSTGLTSVTIPSNVTSLGKMCFNGCNSLNTYQLYWTNNNIITYDSSTMPNNTNTKFYVPKGQKTNYVNKGYPSAKVVERSS